MELFDMYAQYVSTIFGKEFFSENWQEILHSIENLKPNDALIISPHSKTSEKAGEEIFSICFASNGLYVCFLYDGDEFYAENPYSLVNEYWDVYMGHHTVRHAKYFLEQIDAIQITKSYYEQGIKHPNFSWSNDNQLPENL